MGLKKCEEEIKKNPEMEKRLVSLLGKDWRELTRYTKNGKTPTSVIMKTMDKDSLIGRHFKIKTKKEEKACKELGEILERKKEER